MLLQEYEDRKIDYLNATDMMGMSLLHFAAMNKQQNNTEILRILLRKGVAVNAVARDHTTPLDYAATTGGYENILQYVYRQLLPEMTLSILGNYLE